MTNNKTTIFEMDVNLFQAKCCINWFFTFVGIAIGVWVSRIPEIKESYGLSDGFFGLVLFFCVCGAISSAPLITYFNSNYGSKSGVVLGSAILCGVLPVVGLGLNLYVLIFSVFGLGLSLACVDISINTQASIAEKIARSSLMGVFYGWYSIGGVAGVLAGGLMQSSNLNTFISFSVVSICCLVLSVFFSLKLISRDDGHDILMASLDQSNLDSLNDPDSARRGNRMVLYLCILGFLCNLGEGSMVDWSTIYLTEVMGATPFFSSVAFALFSASLGFGRFSSDYLMNRYGAGVMLSLAGVISSIGLIIIILSPSLPVKYVMVCVGLSLLGFFVSFGVPVVNTTAGRIPGKNVDEVFAYTIPSSYVAFLLGPPTLGWLSQATGSLRFAFIVIAGLVFSVSAIVQCMPREIMWSTGWAGSAQSFTIGREDEVKPTNDVSLDPRQDLEEGEEIIGEPPDNSIGTLVNADHSNAISTLSVSAHGRNNMADFETNAEYQELKSADA